MKKLSFLLLSLFLITSPVWAATKQYIIGGSSDDPVNTGGTEYNNLMGNGNIVWISTEAGRIASVPTAGTLSDFKVQVQTAPGAGTSWTFTIRTGNPIGNSALSVSIADTNTTSALDTDQVAVVAGDLVSMSAVGTSTPTAAGAVYWTCKFTPTTAGETILLSTCGWTTQLTYATPIGSKGAPASTLFNGQTLFPTAGTLKNFYMRLSAAPGTGTDRTFKIDKNGTDSSIAITISGGATTGNDTTNTLTVAAGDRITIQETAITGTPATSSGQAGIVFVPNTQGEWFTAAGHNSGVSNSATQYQQLTCPVTTLTATENEQYNLAQATTAKAIYVALSIDPGNAAQSDNYAFTLRRNGTTNTALTVTITADNTTGNYATDVAISANDLLTTEIVPGNAPSATPIPQIAYLFYDAPTGGAAAPMEVIWIQ